MASLLSPLCYDLCHGLDPELGLLEGAGALGVLYSVDSPADVITADLLLGSGPGWRRSPDPEGFMSLPVPSGLCLSLVSCQPCLEQLLSTLPHCHAVLSTSRNKALRLRVLAVGSLGPPIRRATETLFPI